MHLVYNDSPESSHLPVNPSTHKTHNDRIHDAIASVQRAAQADTSRVGQTHADFLEAIRQLNLVAESPQETLMRIRFEVIFHIYPHELRSSSAESLAKGTQSLKPLQVAAIRLTLEIGALDAIVAKDGAQVSAKELGQFTGYDALMIGVLGHLANPSRLSN